MPTLTASSEDVRIYEIAIMYQPNLDQKAESTLIKNIEGLLAEAKAVVLFKDPWSKRGLAYTIKGFDEAKFVIYYVEAAPAEVRELDTQLRLEKGVMRHLIVLPPKGYEAISYESFYQDWMKNRETVAAERQRKKEEKLKKQVTANAKRASKRTDVKKVAPAKPIEAELLSSELDKLISDDDLKM